MAFSSEAALMQVCVKNTFIDFADATEDEHGLSKRRSSSLPRSMKILEKEHLGDEPLLLECDRGSDTDASAPTPSNVGSSCETFSDGGDSTEASSSGSLVAEDFPEPPAVQVPRQRTKLKVTSAAWCPTLAPPMPVYQQVQDQIRRKSTMPSPKSQASSWPVVGSLTSVSRRLEKVSRCIWLSETKLRFNAWRGR